MNLRAEVGIYIEKDSRQQGYASEAIELIKKYDKSLDKRTEGLRYGLLYGILYCV